jgi:CheY-like chemotaxis protein
MKTILVIDDESSIRDYVQFLLEREGYTVLTAKDGKEGIAEFHRNGRVDLIITDLVMPEKEGLEALVALCGSNPALKIIAISGVINSQAYLSLASKLGAHATI